MVGDALTYVCIDVEIIYFRKFSSRHMSTSCLLSFIFVFVVWKSIYKYKSLNKCSKKSIVCDVRELRYFRYAKSYSIPIIILNTSNCSVRVHGILCCEHIFVRTFHLSPLFCPSFKKSVHWARMRSEKISTKTKLKNAIPCRGKLCFDSK